MVAAGGGGGGRSSAGKVAGGVSLNGITQTAGYAFYSGQGGSNVSSGGPGGGGGGYWGGRVTSNQNGGYGGSSYVSGHVGCIAITSSSSTTAKCSSGSSVDCATHYSGKAFTSTRIVAGNASMPSTSGSTETGHAGNGYAKITFVE